MRRPKSKPVRILVVDDHPLMRAALAKIFDTQQDMDVVGEAGDGVQAAGPNTQSRRDHHGYSHASSGRAGRYPTDHHGWPCLPGSDSD